MLPNCKRMFSNYIPKTPTKTAQITAGGRRTSPFSCDFAKIFA
jgi:hypothetical protein